MPSKGAAGGDSYLAYNTSTGAYVTGDVANHTIRFLQDGAEATPTNSPTEPDATNLPGHYVITWTSAEANCNILTIGGKSNTSNVIIIPKTIGFQNLPTANFNTTGGLTPMIFRAATAATGATASTIVFDSGASGSDDFYTGCFVTIISGTGSTQVRQILSYTGASKTATVFIAAAGNTQAQGQQWVTLLDSSSGFAITPFAVHSAGLPNNFSSLNINSNGQVDLGNILGTAVQTSAAQLGVNVIQYNSRTAQTDANSLPKVDVEDVLGTAVQTSAAQFGVNLVTINGANTVTSSAQLGVNLVTWEGAPPAPLIGGLVQATVSGSANVNVTQWAGGNVPAPNVTGEPLVDVNHWRGTQPNTLVSNRVDSSVGALAAGVIINTSFGTGALTTACFATNFFTAALLDITAGNAIADDLLDRANAIESSITPRQAWRYTAAAEAGVTAGALTNTFTIAAIANAGTNRISASTDQSGNRLSVTLN